MPSGVSGAVRLLARSKRAIRRRLDAAGQCRSHRTDQGGFSLVESVVAVAVLAIVLVPTIHIVLVSQVTTNQQRIEGEASTVATQAIQDLQNQVQQGIMPNGSTQQTVKAGNDVFTVRVAFTATSHGTSTTYCTTANGSAPGTWFATATVTWHGMRGALPITDTTEVAPGIAGALDGSTGTIAVPILNPNGTPFAVPTVPVTVTLTGTWTKGPGTAPTQPPVPSGEIASGSVNTTNGCAVFLAVDPDPGWTYVVSINNASNSATGGPAELINSAEESYDNPSPIPTIGPYAVQVGEPTLTSGFSIAEAAPVTVPASAFSTVGFPTILPTQTVIPVTVGNSGLGTGGGTYSFTTLSGGTTMYLFPYTTAYTVWAGEGRGQQSQLRLREPGYELLHDYAPNSICAGSICSGVDRRNGGSGLLDYHAPRLPTGADPERRQ